MSYGEIYKTTWWGNPTPEGWGNSYFDKYFKPSQITGLKLWSYAEVEPRPSWNVSGFQLNNEADATTNLKSKTGGYYVANSATEDWIDIPEITLSGDFTITYLTNIPTAGAATNAIGLSGLASSRLFVNSSNQFVATIGGINYTFTTTAISTGWHLIYLERSGSDLSLYIDGILNERKSSVSTSNVVLNLIGKLNITSYDTTIGFFSFFNSAFEKAGEFYNNPQRFVELSRQYGADRIYDFNIGNGEVGYTVFDLSGNDQHGTIQSVSAPAGTNFIYNDAEVGAQQVLESRNSYYWFDGVDDDVTLSSTIDYGTGDFDFTIKVVLPSNTAGHLLATTTDFTARIFYNATGRISIQNGVAIVSSTTLFDFNQNVKTFRFIRTSGVVDIYLNGEEYEFGLAFNDDVSFNSLGGSFGGAILNFKGIFISFEDSNHKIENHTGFQDSIGSITPTINGSPQSIFISESSTKGIDLFGNAITNKWKQGLLNFTGLDLVDNAHGGVEFGNQVDVADVTERTIERSLEYVDNGSDIVLETNGVAGVSGYELKISSTGKVVYTNGANTPLQSTTTLTDGTKYDIILHHAGTTAELFITELGNSHSTSDASGTVGAIDAGTVIPNLSGNSLTTPSIHFDGDTTTSEKTNLSRYNNSKY